MSASLSQYFERKIGLLENLPVEDSTEHKRARLRISHLQDHIAWKMGSKVLNCDLPESKGAVIDLILDRVTTHELLNDQAFHAMAGLISRD